MVCYKVSSTPGPYPLLGSTRFSGLSERGWRNDRAEAQLHGTTKQMVQSKHRRLRSVSPGRPNSSPKLLSHTVHLLCWRELFRKKTGWYFLLKVLILEGHDPSFPLPMFLFMHHRIILTYSLHSTCSPEHRKVQVQMKDSCFLG